MLDLGRRADLVRALRDGDPRPRRTTRSRSPARRPGSSPTPSTARRRSSRSARGRIHDALDAKRIVLVAGFQGVSTDFEVTTLGRGGSDTTAVALAAALGADACEIYTDVEGVFTADPRVVPSARKLDAVTYEEMLEMAAAGAKVMPLRSVEFARNHNVKLHVRSTFGDADGHVDRRGGRADAREGDHLRRRPHSASETALPRARASTGARCSRALAEAQRQRRHDRPDRGRRDRLLGARRGSRRRRGARCGALGVEWSMRDDLGKVTLVGAGMKSHPGVAARRRSRRSRPPGSRSKIVSTSPIKIALPRPQPRTCRARCRRCTTRSSSRRADALSRGSAVVGATGAVGTVTLRLLARARLPRRPRLRVGAVGRASSSTTGATVEEATPEALSRGRHRHRLFSVGTSASRELVPHAVARRGGRGRQVGGVPARADGIPLVVPEVNAARALEHDGIVANPNCCTIPLTCVLKPLHEAAGLRARAGRDLPVGLGRGRAADGAARATRRPTSTTSRMDWSFDGEEFDEESKLRAETRKIMELPDLPMSATCVRVPVMVGHAEAVWLETEEPLSAEQARELWAAAPSVRVEDVPTPGRGGADRRGARRPDPPRPRREQRPRALPRLRQPAQGRGAERDPDRGAPARARARSRRHERLGLARRLLRERASCSGCCCSRCSPPRAAGMNARELLAFVPDCVVLFRRLAADPEVPRRREARCSARRPSTSCCRST